MAFPPNPEGHRGKRPSSRSISVLVLRPAEYAAPIEFALVERAHLALLDSRKAQCPFEEARRRHELLQHRHRSGSGCQRHSGAAERLVDAVNLTVAQRPRDGFRPVQRAIEFLSERAVTEAMLRAVQF